jgi:hypothetical protein
LILDSEYIIIAGTATSARGDTVKARLLKMVTTAGLLIGALVVSLAVTELSAAIYHRIETGIWLPEDTSGRPAAVEAKPTVPRMILSPYHGAVFRPGWTASEDGSLVELASKLGLTEVPEWMRYKANSFGFIAPVDYPYQPVEDEFIVGIFGSSVANQFAQQGAKEIADGLQRLPGMAKRKVRVLSFAVGGQKQPQQLLALSYFYSIGQKFDLIVNLDGVNEAWGAWWNLEKAGIDWSVPLAHLLLGSQDLLSKCCTADLIKLSEVDAKQRDAEWISTHTRSALIHYGVKAYSNLLAAQATQLRSSASLNHPKVDYIILARSDTSKFDDRKNAVVENWARSSIGMSAIAKQLGAIYVHILPPNQYASKKILTAKEQRSAFYDNWVGDVYRQIVPKTYSAMLAQRDALERHGVAFLNATPLFDEFNETLYADGGGHFHQRGYELLARGLVSFVRERNAQKESMKTSKQ